MSRQALGGSKGLPTGLTTDPARHHALRAFVPVGLSCRNYFHTPESAK